MASGCQRELCPSTGRAPRACTTSTSWAGTDGSMSGFLRVASKKKEPSFAVGAEVELKDRDGRLLKARILSAHGRGAGRRFEVHFCGWAAWFDEEVGEDSLRDVGSGPPPTVEEGWA
mgnify:CR=1 FL=1